MVVDFNLSYVAWVNGLVAFPVNSIYQHSRTKNKYLDLFPTKEFYWFIKEDTICKLMGNSQDKTTSDQMFSNNEFLIGEVSLKAPLGKSYVYIEIEVKVKPDGDYINSKERNWSQLTEELLSEKGNNTDWTYKFTTLENKEILEKLNRKVKFNNKKYSCNHVRVFKQRYPRKMTLGQL